MVGVGNRHGRRDCLTCDPVWADPDSYRLKLTPAFAQCLSNVIRALVLCSINVAWGLLIH